MSTKDENIRTARARMIAHYGRERFEAMEKQAAADEWDGVSVDVEPLPLWVAVLCVLALLAVIAAVVWGVVVGGARP